MLDLKPRETIFVLLRASKKGKRGWKDLGIGYVRENRDRKIRRIKLKIKHPKSFTMIDIIKQFNYASLNNFELLSSKLAQQETSAG